MNIVRVIILTIVFLFNVNCCCAAGQEEINRMFLIFDKIINENDIKKYGICVEYSIEILKGAPRSLESYYVLSMLPGLDDTTIIKNKISELKIKYYEDINNIEINTAEKMIMMFFLARGIDSNSLESKLSFQKQFVDWLNTVKNNCSLKDYSALATIFLFLDKENGYQNIKYFKTSFPEHPFVPLVNLELTADFFEKEDYLTAIDELKKLSGEYPDIITPHGSKIKYEYYSAMFINYMQLKDFENARKIVKTIEAEDPNFHSLKKLKDKIDSIK